MNQSINRSRRAKEARGNPRARRRATTATAPSRPRLAAVADAKPQTRNPRRENARIAASHPRAGAAEIRDAPPRSNRHLVPTHRIDRSIDLVSGPSHLFHARVVRIRVRVRTYLASTSLSTKHVECRRRASRCAPVACIRGRRRDGTGGRVSRALCICVSMFNARYTCFNREVVAPQPYLLGLARCRF